MEMHLVIFKQLSSVHFIVHLWRDSFQTFCFNFFRFLNFRRARTIATRGRWYSRIPDQGSEVILGAFAKLRKATISSIMSVCPSVRMEQLGSHWTDFYETLYLSIFLKSVEKIQVSLKFGKNNGYFTWRPVYIYDNISLNSSYNEKYFRQKL
jgi:hypothetical protein